MASSWGLINSISITSVGVLLVGLGVGFLGGDNVCWSLDDFAPSLDFLEDFVYLPWALSESSSHLPRYYVEGHFNRRKDCMICADKNMTESHLHL